MQKLSKTSMIQGFDYVGVGIGAVIFDPRGKVLLAKRGKKAKNEHGKWEFPGGSLHFGESLKETIAREIKEELDITIAPKDFFGVTEYISPDKKQHWIGTDVICKLVDGEVKIMEPEKCAGFKWVNLEEVEKMNLTIYSKQTLKQLTKYLKVTNYIYH